MNDQTNQTNQTDQANQASEPKYKALMIRKDARDAIDEAKAMFKERTGIDLNYSQLVKHMCSVFMESADGKGR